MIKITVDNTQDGSHDLYEINESAGLKSTDDLQHLFGGEMLFDVDDEGLIHESDYCEGRFPEDEVVFRVIKAQWAFGDTSGGFLEYVQQEMNDLEVSGVLGVLEGGILSGYTELIWNNKCREVFTTYMAEIEEILDDADNNFALTSIIEENGFDIPSFVQMAFEQAVRHQVESFGVIV